MFVEQMLITARERLVTVDVVAPVTAVAALMAQPHTDLVVVCEGDAMVGVVTKTDIVAQIGRCRGGACMARVETIMIRDVVSCRPNDLLADLWSVMKARGLQRIPVIDPANVPLGIIYARDALQNMLGEVENEDQLLRDYIGGVGYR